MEKIKFQNLIKENKNNHKKLKQIINKYIMNELSFTEPQLNKLIKLKNTTC